MRLREGLGSSRKEEPEFDLTFLGVAPPELPDIEELGFRVAVFVEG